MSKILQKKIAIHQEPSKEMEILAPYSDWAEQDPDTWWKYTCKATIKIITESGIKASLITSISIAYQMHGLVIVDKVGKPLRNAIIWCDSRAVEIVNEAY